LAIKVELSTNCSSTLEVHLLEQIKECIDSDLSQVGGSSIAKISCIFRIDRHVDKVSNETELKVLKNDFFAF